MGESILCIILKDIFFVKLNWHRTEELLFWIDLTSKFIRIFWESRIICLCRKSLASLQLSRRTYLVCLGNRVQHLNPHNLQNCILILATLRCFPVAEKSSGKHPPGGTRNLTTRCPKERMKHAPLGWIFMIAHSNWKMDKKFSECKQSRWNSYFWDSRGMSTFRNFLHFNRYCCPLKKDC